MGKRTQKEGEGQREMDQTPKKNEIITIIYPVNAEIITEVKEFQCLCSVYLNNFFPSALSVQKPALILC